MHIYSHKALLSLCKWVCRTYSYNMISRASSRAEWGPDAVWGCPTGSEPRHFYCLLMHNFAAAARKHVHNIDASCYGEIQWHHQRLLCIYNYSFIKNQMGHHVRILETHLNIFAVVFGAQIESRKAARQVQPTEKPHQIPEHNGVVIHNGCRRDGLVSLVFQQALQFFPKYQRTQVGHGNWLLQHKKIKITTSLMNWTNLWATKI